MYIDLLPNDGLVLTHLEDNLKLAKSFILSLPEEKLTYRYAVDKCTIKEILVHIIDDERIYSYRALRFTRNDQTNLPGFEQDKYTLNSGANERDIDSIFEEYKNVRYATIHFYNGLEATAFDRLGTADGNTMSVRASVYHIAGHELYHMNIIKERYLQITDA